MWRHLSLVVVRKRRGHISVLGTDWADWWSFPLDFSTPLLLGNTANAVNLSKGLTLLNLKFAKKSRNTFKETPSNPTCNYRSACVLFICLNLFLFSPRNLGKYIAICTRTTFSPLESVLLFSSLTTSSSVKVVGTRCKNSSYWLDQE